MAQAILAEVSVKDQLRLSVLASMEQNQGVEPAAKKRRTTGIVEALAARLKDGNHKRVQLAAEGIAELASNDRNQVFIAQVAGVVAGLSSILRSGPDHAKRSAARAIGHLVCDHDENKVLVAQAAGVLEGLATHRVKTHSRTIWKGVEREVKRIELDTKAAELDKREQEKVVDNQSSGSGSTDNQAAKDPTSCHTKDCDFAVVVDDHNAASMVASLVKFVRNRSFRLQEA